MIAAFAAALALFSNGTMIAPGHGYMTPETACGQGYYNVWYVVDVPSGKRLRSRWNADGDRLLFAGEHGWVHYDGLRVVNRSQHVVRFVGGC